MIDLNTLHITGNLTRDPEVKYTPAGTAVCSFGIASNRTWKDASGAEKEDVFFGDCLAYARTAEVIAEHFKKGRKILVVGRLKLETWDDKQSGQKKRATRIIVESFQFMGSPQVRDNDEADAAASRGGRASAPPPPQAPRRNPTPPPRPPADPDLDAAPDDIPF